MTDQPAKPSEKPASELTMIIISLMICATICFVVWRLT
jgi:hypothetical protein